MSRLFGRKRFILNVAAGLKVTAFDLNPGHTNQHVILQAWDGAAGVGNCWLDVTWKTKPTGWHLQPGDDGLEVETISGLTSGYTGLGGVYLGTYTLFIYTADANATGVLYVTCGGNTFEVTLNSESKLLLESGDLLLYEDSNNLVLA